MRRRSSRLAPLFFILASAAAHAQTLPSIDARTWRPSTDPSAGLVLEPAATPGAGSWNVGAIVSYTHHPITLRRASTGDVAFRPLEVMFGADLVAAMGLGSRASVGLSIPMVFYQDGSNGLPTTVHTSGSVPFSALGDLGLHGKAAIVQNDAGGFGLSALANATLPTGDRASFLGEGSLTATARILVEYTLIVASAQASLGYSLRTENRMWPDASVGGFTLGDVIPWTAGVSLKPGIFKLDPDNRQRWDLSFRGWIPATPVGPFGAGEPGSAKQTPVLLNVSDRIALGHTRDVYAIGGFDLGLTDAVGVPAFRVMAGIGWAPREHDMDHDGVPDDVDQCPDVPEDRDGFEDSDGCPEIDDDDDGIIDKEDACPRVPGVESPDRRKNGCPAGDADGHGTGDSLDEGDKVAKTDFCPDQPEGKDGSEDGCPAPDPDRDGDTYDNDKDQCPEDAEVYNGIKDDDGCPDEGGNLLVSIDPKDPKLGVKLAAPIKILGAGDAQEVDKANAMTMRALALELNRHRDWTLAIGVRPAGAAPDAQQTSLARAFAVVHALAALSHRDGIAETVGWDAVKNRPHSDSGVGLLVLVTPPPPTTPRPVPSPTPLPTTAPPNKP